MLNRITGSTEKNHSFSFRIVVIKVEKQLSYTFQGLFDTYLRARMQKISISSSSNWQQQFSDFELYFLSITSISNPRILTISSTSTIQANNSDEV